MSQFVSSSSATGFLFKVVTVFVGSILLPSQLESWTRVHHSTGPQC